MFLWYKFLWYIVGIIESNPVNNGKYNCKRQGCWFSHPYVQDQEYGIYYKNNSNCAMCQDKCNNDRICGAVECGGDSTCVWWKVDKCTNKNSPGFFTYSPNQYHYGYTCYKDE